MYLMYCLLVKEKTMAHNGPVSIEQTMGVEKITFVIGVYSVWRCEGNEKS